MAFLWVNIYATWYYLLIVDPLLDLSHGPFLHAGTLMARGETDVQDAPSAVAGDMQHKVWSEGAMVHSTYVFPPMPVMGLVRPMTEEKSLVLAAG